MPSEFIGLSEPCLQGREWEYVKDCLDTGWVSSVGSYVSRFEQMVAEQSGTGHAIATVNGTAALHISLLLAGVRPDEEVIVSDLTFIAPANAIRYTGAWPILVDCELSHWQMDISLVADFLHHSCERKAGGVFNRCSGRRIAAILPVHILGHPCDMAALMDLAAFLQIPVIEDATESLGALCYDHCPGSLGLAGCVSFNGNKILTTGGGGMIVTNDEQLAARARHLTTQAKCDAAEYIHDEIGYNYRLTNVLAAIGCAQMEQLDSHLQAKFRIAAGYRDGLAGFPGLSWQEPAPWAQPNHWLPTVRVDPADAGVTARQLRDHLAASQVQARPLWQPMHLSPPYKEMSFIGRGNSRVLYDECLSLPCSVSLTAERQQRVIECLTTQFPQR